METNEGSALRKYLRDNSITQEDFASKLDLTRQGLGVHLRKAKLSTGFKLQLKELGVDIFSISKEPSANGNVSIVPIAKAERNEKMGFPVYDAIATSGPMENVSQLSGQPLFYMQIPGYEDCNMGLYNYGHSMYPTIESGNLLALRMVNDKSVILYGEIYLVRTKDYFIVKRLQKSEVKGNVLCTSDNFEKRSPEFKRFESFDIAIDKIIDLYLVKGIFKKTQS